MVKNKILVFIFSLLIVVSLVGQVSAGFTSISIASEFQSGVVDIEILERTADQKDDVQTILPYDRIERNAYIVNKGSDCYVRIKFIFSNTEVLNVSNLVGLSDNWIAKDDGYYYYAEALKGNEAVDIYNGIQLGEIDEKYKTADCSIGIEADAIQTQNFTLDLSSATPWGNVEVSKIDKDNSGLKEYKPLPNEEFKILYRDDVKGMMKNFDSFFTDIGILMPGDKYEDMLEILNDISSEQDIYFATNCTANKEFLSKMKFTIKDEDGNIVFSGNLGESKEVKLATLAPKERKSIIFQIEIPAEMQNEFALNESAVKWTFATERINNSPPKTGDDFPIWMYTMLMVVSTIGLYFSARGLVNGKKNI